MSGILLLGSACFLQPNFIGGVCGFYNRTLSVVKLVYKIVVCLLLQEFRRIYSYAVAAATACNSLLWLSHSYNMELWSNAARYDNCKRR